MRTFKNSRQRTVGIFVWAITFVLMLAFGFGVSGAPKTAYAERKADAFTVIGSESNDLFKGGDESFNAELLNSLYTALGVTADEVKNKTATEKQAQTSALQTAVKTSPYGSAAKSGTQCILQRRETATWFSTFGSLRIIT